MYTYAVQWPIESIIVTLLALLVKRNRLTIIRCIPDLGDVSTFSFPPTFPVSEIEISYTSN